jgi:hypothetical protein
VGQLLALLVVMRVETIGRLQTCIGSDTFTKLMQLNLRQCRSISWQFSMQGSRNKISTQLKPLRFHLACKNFEQIMVQIAHFFTVIYASKNWMSPEKPLAIISNRTDHEYLPTPIGKPQKARRVST